MSIKSMLQERFNTTNEILELGFHGDFEFTDYEQNSNGTWDGVKITIFKNHPNVVDTKRYSSCECWLDAGGVGND